MQFTMESLPLEMDEVIDLAVACECDTCRGNRAERYAFNNLASQGSEPLVVVMAFMMGNQTFRALEVICRGNNWRDMAYALSVFFHRGDNVPLRIQKARGYDRLRGLVSTCVYDLNHEWKTFPNGYERLVQRLFTSLGYAAPE